MPGADAGARCRGAGGTVLWLAVAAVIALAGDAAHGRAQAHHRADPAAIAAGGLPIPALTHGEMAVVARHGVAIRALADAQRRTDATFRRLANFAALQRTYCLWGLVPGSLADEASPFNECLHAYLAALRALLAHMQAMPEGAERARALARRIDAEMAASGAASDVCRNSADTFTTAQIIIPEWREIPQHPPSLLALAGVAVMAAAGVWAVSGRHGASG